MTSAFQFWVEAPEAFLSSNLSSASPTVHVFLEPAHDGQIGLSPLSCLNLQSSCLKMSLVISSNPDTWCFPTHTAFPVSRF